MRILYIATDNPAVDAIIDGMHTETLVGLPAFYYPFRMLLNRGHTIDILLYSFEERTVVESEHFKAENLIQIHPKNGVLPGAVEYALQISFAARKLMGERQYDFVYGMSEGAHLAVREAAKRGIPCGLRQFGTWNLVKRLESVSGTARRWKLALSSNTYIALSAKGKKDFLLVTDDGSESEKIPELLGIRELPYRAFYWRTGVKVPKPQPSVDNRGEAFPERYDNMVLSHIGRLCELKRGDRSLSILNLLHQKGYPFHLYFVGDIREKTFQEKLVRQAQEADLESFIHFTGAVTQEEIRAYARNSFATLLTSDLNMGNVFYEIMSEGSLLLTNDNHSLDEFIVDGQNCVTYEPGNAKQAAEKIIELTQDPERVKAMRAAAYQTACDRFLSIEKRFQTEVDLIEDTAAGRDISKYPNKM